MSDQMYHIKAFPVHYQADKEKIGKNSIAFSKFPTKFSLMQTGVVCLPPVIVLQTMKPKAWSWWQSIFMFLPIQIRS